MMYIHRRAYVYAYSQIIAKVQKDSLKTLPSPEHPCELSTCIIELERIRRSDLCITGGVKVSVIIDGLISVVRGLHEGIGVSSEKLASFDPYFKKCILQMENFVTFDVPTVGKQGDKRYAPGHRVHGHKALEGQFNDMSKAMKSDTSAVTVGDLKHFRVFDWMLTKEQREMRETWLEIVVKEALRLKRSVKDQTPAADVGVQPIAANSSSSASGSVLGVSQGLHMISSTQKLATGKQAGQGASKGAKAGANTLKSSSLMICLCRRPRAWDAREF